MPLKGVKFTLLLEKENVGGVPSASGTLALTFTTVMGVLQTLPTGENKLMLVYGYVETAIHTDTYTPEATTLH